MQGFIISLLAISARLPQVLTNFKNKSTGQLSIVTSTLNFLGVAARIFTTIQEVNDPLVLVIFLLLFNNLTLSTRLVSSTPLSGMDLSLSNA